MKRFALIGAAGFIAPKHMKAIKDTGNILVAAFDKFDSVGVMDNYFPEADFFTEFERFDRHVERLKREHKRIDFISVCSPNYLHDAHIRFALRHQCAVICEKPLVLNPWNLDALFDIEKETGQRIFNILQLRHHPDIVRLKEKVETSLIPKKYVIDLTYITARGKWYQRSWKGDTDKSGGIATNIGIHFFDLLIWIFGDVQSCTVNLLNDVKSSGMLELQHAQVNWFLSIDGKDLPEAIKNNDHQSFRSMIVDDEEYTFSDGFANLHTTSYQAILDGKGYGVEDVRKSIELVHLIRNSKVC